MELEQKNPIKRKKNPPLFGTSRSHALEHLWSKPLRKGQTTTTSDEAAPEPPCSSLADCVLLPHELMEAKERLKHRDRNESVN